MDKNEALNLAREAFEQYLPYQLNEKERIALAAIKTLYPLSQWIGLTEQDFSTINQSCLTKLQAATSAESILKMKNNV